MRPAILHRRLAWHRPVSGRMHRAERITGTLPRCPGLRVRGKAEAVEPVHYLHDLDDLVRSGIELRPRADLVPGKFSACPEDRRHQQRDAIIALSVAWADRGAGRHQKDIVAIDLDVFR